VVIIPLNAHKSEKVTQISESLYESLQAAGLDVLLDDRDKKTSPGVKFADMELIGIPHRLVVSDRGLENEVVEYKKRGTEDTQDVPVSKVVDFLKDRVTID